MSRLTALPDIARCPERYNPRKRASAHMLWRQRAEADHERALRVRERRGRGDGRSNAARQTPAGPLAASGPTLAGARECYELYPGSDSTEHAGQPPSTVFVGKCSNIPRPSKASCCWASGRWSRVIVHKYGACGGWWGSCVRSSSPSSGHPVTGPSPQHALEPANY
jgi:hypothetical protein